MAQHALERGVQKAWQSEPIQEGSLQIQWRTWSSQTRKTKTAQCTNLEEDYARSVAVSVSQDFDHVARDNLMEVDTVGTPLAVSRLELVRRGGYHWSLFVSIAMVALEQRRSGI